MPSTADLPLLYTYLYSKLPSPPHFCPFQIPPSPPPNRGYPLSEAFQNFQRSYGFNYNGHLFEILQYMSNGCSFLSGYCISAFTIERFIIVCYPFQRHLICTSTRAVLVVILLTVVGFTYNLHTPLLTEVQIQYDTSWDQNLLYAFQ